MSTIHLCARGHAAGEHALAARFATAAIARGHRVVAWLEAVEGVALIEASGAELRRLPAPSDFRTALRHEQAHALVAATSLTTAEHHHAAAGFGGPVCTLDSSWLYWTAAGLPHAHVEHFLVALPPEVFAAGHLPGPRSAPASVLERTTPLGWFGGPIVTPAPSDHVALYFGRGYAPAERPWLPALARAVAGVAASRPGLRWRFVGPEAVAWPPIVERESGWLSEPTFESLVGSARLLLCHHGQVVIGLAAYAGVRAVAFAMGRVFRGAPHDFGDREVIAFERAGLVDAVFGPTTSGRIAARIDAQLAGPQRPPVGNVDGAERAVRLVEARLGQG